MTRAALLAVGDAIAIEGSGQGPGDFGRSGVLTGVFGPPGRVIYCVRWADGRETMFRPGDTVLITGRRGRKEGGGDAAGRDR